MNISAYPHNQRSSWDGQGTVADSLRANRSIFHTTPFPVSFAFSRKTVTRPGHTAADDRHLQRWWGQSCLSVRDVAVRSAAKLTRSNGQDTLVCDRTVIPQFAKYSSYATLQETECTVPKLLQRHGWFYSFFTHTDHCRSCNYMRGVRHNGQALHENDSTIRP